MKTIEILGQLAIVTLFVAFCGVLVFVLQYFARRFLEEEGLPDGDDDDDDDDEEAAEEARRAEVVRGRPIATIVEARLDLKKNARPRKKEPRPLFHGGLWLPREEETNHLANLGTTGSGKSVTSRIHLKYTVGRVARPLPGERVGAVVYDCKRSEIPLLAALVGEERLLILNPFDARSAAPDFAAMYDTEARLHQLAEALAPTRRQEAQPFWTAAAQDLITGVGMVFNATAPGAWDLRDLLEAFASVERLRFVLEQADATRTVATNYLAPEAGVMAPNLMASTRANLRDFRPVAAAWDRCATKVHLKDFVRGLGKVLVLQPDEEKRRASRATQRLILQRVIEYVLDLDDAAWRRLFFSLDEVQELGAIELLPRLLSVGRSKGAAVFLYSQTIGGLVKEYGQEDTQKIMENISSRAFFALHGESARWGARQFGEVELKRRTRSTNWGQQISYGEGEQFTQQGAVFDSDLMGLRPPSPEQGLPGIYSCRLTRPFASNLKGLDRLLPAPDPGVPAFLPRPAEDEVLRPWTIEDVRRLNLVVKSEADWAALGIGRPGDDGPDAAEPEATPEAPPGPHGDRGEKAADGIFGKLKGKFRKGR